MIGYHIDPETLRPVIDDIEAFRAAHAGDPALEVLIALWAGDVDAADDAVDALRFEAPDFWRWRALAADVDVARGETGRAIRVLEGLVSEHSGTPREAVLWQHLGKAYFAGGDDHGAASAFACALRLREHDGAPADQIESSRMALARAVSRGGRRAR